MKIIILMIVAIIFSTGFVVMAYSDTLSNNEGSFTSYAISDHPGEWYLGENLKTGDYFEYEFSCAADQKLCNDTNMKLWIRDKIQHENYTSWETVFLISQNNQNIWYDIKLEEYTLFPTSIPDGFHKQGGYYHSMIWLSSITAAEDNYGNSYNGEDSTTTGSEKDILRFGPDLSQKLHLKHDPKKFADSSWGRYGNWLLGGEIILQKIETMHTPAGKFDAVALKVEPYKEQPGFHSDNTTWIADEFPFPVKSTASILGSGKNHTTLYELQNYLEDMSEDVFYQNHAKGFENLKPPRHQVADGVDADNIICKINLKLIYKATDNSPACVAFDTIPVLKQRGWTA